MGRAPTRSSAAWGVAAQRQAGLRRDQPADRGPPPLVEARSGDLLAVADELERRGYRKIGVEGGGQLIRGLIAIGRLDVLEMAIIPLVLGDGIPLFPAGTPELPLTLSSASRNPAARCMWSIAGKAGNTVAFSVVKDRE